MMDGVGSQDEEDKQEEDSPAAPTELSAHPAAALGALDYNWAFPQDDTANVKHDEIDAESNSSQTSGASKAIPVATRPEALPDDFVCSIW